MMRKMANKDAKSEERHYVYLVRCADDSLYCGWTTDLKRRIDAHNGHIPGGAKYTVNRMLCISVLWHGFSLIFWQADL